MFDQRFLFDIWEFPNSYFSSYSLFVQYHCYLGYRYIRLSETCAYPSRSERMSAVWPELVGMPLRPDWQFNPSGPELVGNLTRVGRQFDPSRSAVLPGKNCRPTRIRADWHWLAEISSELPIGIQRCRSARIGPDRHKSR